MDGHLQRVELPASLHATLDPEHLPHAAELMTKQLRGANAAVRELLLALSVGFALPGPLPADLRHKVGRGAVEDLDALVDRAEAAGLLMPDGTVAGPARHALLTVTPTAKIHALQRELRRHGDREIEPLSGRVDPGTDRAPGEAEEAGETGIGEPDRRVAVRADPPDPRLVVGHVEVAGGVEDEVVPHRQHPVTGETGRDRDP